jgi:hypothetical protein
LYNEAHHAEIQRKFAWKAHDMTDRKAPSVSQAQVRRIPSPFRHGRNAPSGNRFPAGDGRHHRTAASSWSGAR